MEKQLGHFFIFLFCLDTITIRRNKYARDAMEGVVFRGCLKSQTTLLYLRFRMKENYLTLAKLISKTLMQILFVRICSFDRNSLVYWNLILKKTALLTISKHALRLYSQFNISIFILK